MNEKSMKQITQKNVTKNHGKVTQIGAKMAPESTKK